MNTTVVIRAEDPARAAAIARAIGVPLLDPDRPNPDCWHVRTYVNILVTTAVDGRPTVSFAPEEVGQAVSRLEGVVGPEALVRSADGLLVSTEFEGFGLTVERDAPEMRFRDMADVGLRHAMLALFANNRSLILQALTDVGASNPRLAGPSAGRTLKSRGWTLVVDAPEHADLASIEALLPSLGPISFPLRVIRSADVAPDHLAQIDRFGYDI